MSDIKQSATWRAALALHALLATMFFYFVLPSPMPFLVSLTIHADGKFREMFAEPPKEIPAELVRVHMRRGEVRDLPSGVVLKEGCATDEEETDGKRLAVIRCDGGVGAPMPVHIIKPGATARPLEPEDVAEGVHLRVDSVPNHVAGGRKQVSSEPDEQQEPERKK